MQHSKSSDRTPGVGSSDPTGGHSARASSLWDYDGLILDADGVIYRGAERVPYAIETLGPVTQAMPWCVLTNNAANSPSVVADKLSGLGLESSIENVVTSPQGAVAYLHARGFPAGKHVMVVGGPGIEEALRDGGFVPTRDRHDDVIAVVQGFGPTLGWCDLAEASYAIADGVLWVATNLDRNIPTEFGLAPGNGALVAAVSEAVGRSPDAVTGKPEPLLFELAAERMSSSRALVIGDRIDTDIEGANRAGMDSLLVLTGVVSVTDLVDLADADPLRRPTLLAADLQALNGPASHVLISPDAPDSADPLGQVRRSLARAWCQSHPSDAARLELTNTCLQAASELAG
jgi:glycerol 3-phosphatase-2